jgi:hypothetical protein
MSSAHFGREEVIEVRSVWLMRNPVQAYDRKLYDKEVVEAFRNPLMSLSSLSDDSLGAIEAPPLE